MSALAILLAAPQIEGVLPVTWVGLVTSLFVFVGGPAGVWAIAKFFAKLDRYGEDLIKLEARLTTHEDEEEARQKIVDGMLEAMKHLLHRIERAEETSKDCSNNVEKNQQELMNKLEAMTASIHATAIAMEGRMSAIETENRIRAQAQPLFVQIPNPPRG